MAEKVLFEYFKQNISSHTIFKHACRLIFFGYIQIGLFEFQTLMFYRSVSDGGV